jgi:hypothetical protein
MHKVITLFAFLILNSSFFVLNSEAGTVQLSQTGQTTCYDSSGAVINCGGTGQDGNLRAGTAWPSQRFTVSGNCVTDNLTGLVWAKDGNLAGTQTWQGALDWVAAMNSGDGLCGQHDWRLPNLNELESLVNTEQANSATWLNGQGFINVQAYFYWSSSTFAYDTDRAYIVNLGDGDVSADLYKSVLRYRWPVRAGQ